MKMRVIVLVVIVVVVILGVAVAVSFAPETSSIDLSGTSQDATTCLTSISDECFVMPVVSGLNVNSAGVNFPDDFNAEYQLIVLPFDREQQVLAVTWLPLFQELATESDSLQYWSIAALPELTSGVRLLVLGGISAAISDVDVRSQVTVLFLEEQDAFLSAIGVEAIDDIQVLITDADGVLYYRDTGEFTTEKGDAFRTALEILLD